MKPQASCQESSCALPPKAVAYSLQAWMPGIGDYKLMSVMNVDVILQMIKCLNDGDRELLAHKLDLLPKVNEIKMKDSSYRMGFEMYFVDSDLIDFINNNNLQVIRFPASTVHLRIGGAFDYWPSNEKFYCRLNKKKGTGEKALLDQLRRFL